jgi:outer membrane protein OmpA-like peptidoglycan-associated protein
MTARLTPVPLLPHQGGRRALLASLPIAALWLAAPVAALAQSQSGVAVDYGALDNAPPAASSPGEEAPVLLKPPLAPVVLTPPPPPKREVVLLPPRPPEKAKPPASAPASLSVPAAPAPAAPQIEPAATPANVPRQAAMVQFAAAQTTIPPDGQHILDHIAATLVADDTLRLELVAHASGDPDDAVAARRVSLERAVGMREYLIGHGVLGTRMDVKALGDKDAGDGPIDRVDLVLVGR